MRILARTAAVCLAAFVGGLSTFSLSGVPALAHGGGANAVVEVASVDGGYEYGLAFTWSDGDPITGAHILMRASQGVLVETAEPPEVSPGVYIGDLPLVSEGEWVVEVLIHHPDSDGSIGFVQDVIPGEDSIWVVVVDTGNEERVGSRPDPLTSILEPPTASATTTPPATESKNPAAGQNTISTISTTTTEPVTAQETSTEATDIATDIVVDIDTDEKGPAFDIGIRLIHLTAIGLWLIPVFASLFGRRNRTLVVVGTTGVVFTLVTGAVLMLWGTPVSFPGLFNPSALADLSYGSAYVAAFALKITAVLVSAAATLRWTLKVDPRATWVTLAGATLAAVAVTAMSQYHLLSHF